MTSANELTETKIITGKKRLKYKIKKLNLISLNLNWKY